MRIIHPDAQTLCMETLIRIELMTSQLYIPMAHIRQVILCHFPYNYDKYFCFGRRIFVFLIKNHHDCKSYCSHEKNDVIGQKTIQMLINWWKGQAQCDVEMIELSKCLLRCEHFMTNAQSSWTIFTIQLSEIIDECGIYAQGTKLVKKSTLFGAKSNHLKLRVHMCMFRPFKG